MPENVKPGDGSQGGVFSAEQSKAITDIVNAGLATAVKGLKIPSADDLGKLVDGKLTGISEALAKLTEAAPQGGGKPDDKGGKGGSPEDKAAIQNLTKQLEAVTKSQAESQKKAEEAEQKALSTDKESKIRTVLGEFEFTSEDARQDAYQLINGLITRDAEGNLLGQDNLPFDAFIRNFIPEKKGYLLAPLNRSGSGAPSGGSVKSGGPQAGGKFQIEQIKPGMKGEELAAAVRAIRAALPSTGV